MFHFFSILPQKLKEAFRRFPVAFGFVALYWILLAILGGVLLFDDPPKFFSHLGLFALIYPLSAASVEIACRLCKEADRALPRCIHPGLHGLWLVLSLYLALTYTWDQAYSQPYSFICLLFTAFALPFLLPFYAEERDLKVWRFGIWMLKAIWLSLKTALLACLLLCLIALAIHLIASVSRPKFLYAEAVILAFGGVWPLMMLCAFPRLSQCEEEKKGFAYMAARMSSLALLPILCVAQLAIFIYVFPILITFDLPQGILGILTALAMFFWLTIAGFCYPERFQDAPKSNFTLYKILPVSMFALLLITAVAIAQRLLTYGITLKRLYLLAFHLWCYGACIIALLPKQKMLRRLLLSFAAVFAICSFGPWRLQAIAGHCVFAQMEQFVQEHQGPKLPMNAEIYRQFAASLPKEDQAHLQALAKRFKSEAKDYARQAFDFTEPYDPEILQNRN